MWTTLVVLKASCKCRLKSISLAVLIGRHSLESANNDNRQWARKTNKYAYQLQERRRNVMNMHINYKQRVVIPWRKSDGFDRVVVSLRIIDRSILIIWIPTNEPLYHLRTVTATTSCTCLAVSWLISR